MGVEHAESTGLALAIRVRAGALGGVPGYGWDPTPTVWDRDGRKAGVTDVTWRASLPSRLPCASALGVPLGWIIQ